MMRRVPRLAIRALVAAAAVALLGVSTLLTGPPAGAQCPPCVDVNNPSCAINSPSSGAWLKGSVGVGATVGDDCGLNYAKYYVDGAERGTQTVSGVGPTVVSWTWDTHTPGDGSRTVMVKVWDKTGKTNQKSVTVNVDNTPPSVSITQPSQGAVLGGSSVSVTAHATDNLWVRRVYLYWSPNQSTLNQFGDSGDLTQRTSYDLTANWSIGGLADGTYYLRAKAVDRTGNEALSGWVTVTVDNTPSCTLTVPAEGATIGKGSTVTMQATASDTVGVTRVEFYVDSSLLGSDTGAPYQYPWNTSSVSAGSHQVSARAYNALGKWGEDVNTVTVVAVDVDADGVAEADETTKGRFLLINNDDDNSNDTPDKDETVAVTGEEDLVKITVQAVQPGSWSGNVTLSATSGGSAVRMWTTSTKGTQVSLPATYSSSQLPKDLWLEGYQASGAVRDVTLRVSASVNLGTATDEVAATVIAADVTDLGFTNDHLISVWPSGDKIDYPDGPTPGGQTESDYVWREATGVTYPVSYTRDTVGSLSMFGKLSVAPAGLAIGDGVTCRVRARVVHPEFPLKPVCAQQSSGFSLVGTPVEFQGVTGTGTTMSTKVRTTKPSFRWEISVDGGTSWAAVSDSGPHWMHWTEATPKADIDPLYDLALEKACGYVDGSTDFGQRICKGIDGELTYDPSDTPNGHPLDAYSESGSVCYDNAALMTHLSRAIGLDASTLFTWGGCAADTMCRYQPYGGSFWLIHEAHDLAGTDPHFSYHVRSSVLGTVWDPSYGESHSLDLREFAAGGVDYWQGGQLLSNHPQASQRDGSGWWSQEHDVVWQCPH